MHRLVANFYEDLFDREGDPRRNPAHVTELTQKFRQQIGYEVDMVKEASNEYFESYDQQSEKNLFGSDGKGS
tara:strand:+ start:353 stop:568 length:216 start_codon:yes stop_codon:yes gene_type:complete